MPTIEELKAAVDAATVRMASAERELNSATAGWWDAMADLSEANGEPGVAKYRRTHAAEIRARYAEKPTEEAKVSAR